MPWVMLHLGFLALTRKYLDELYNMAEIQTR